MAAFAELLARSCFSFLEGASHPEELCTRARELDLPAIGLCDRDGIYGSVRMLVASRELGQRVIVGAELTLEREGDAPKPYRERPRPTIALLCESHDGYSGLCRLLTRAHAEHEKGEAGVSLADVAAEARGLFAVVPLEARGPLHAAELALVHEAFGERAAIAVWRHFEADDEERLRLAVSAGARFDLPIVASNRPLYHHRRKKRLADVVACIRLGTTLDRAGTALGPNAEAELKGTAEMTRLFPHHPEWVERSVAIAERCLFSLGDLRWRFPIEHGSVDAHLDPNERLARAVEIGVRDRYPGGAPPKVREQLDKELALIAELDVSPYFLSVKHIVDLARERRILCQGRGSAANSAVCFVLGITAVDPVRSSLLFERFMSAARREPPDIDVDFEHERREEVIQEIYARYGRDRAAMVSEVICYRGKSSLREVGKVFGLSNDQLDRLSSLGGHLSCADTPHPGGQTDTSRDRLGRRGLDPDDARLRQVVELAGELQGLPRHLSIHVGGFVLSSEPLDRAAPVEPARMENRTVVPWDKDDIEALGFFKVDVLGLGMLTAIRKSLALVHERAHGSLDGFDPVAALARIPPEDPAVYDAACRADTVGVFQIESRAQMAMLPILKPRSFYDLVVEVGIVRPGPIQGKMVHPYLRRRTGEEPVTYPHPCLEPILSRTLGVPLFQEQVMQIAITGAGYAPGEADQLRRDMAAWRRNGRLLLHRDKLVAGFQARGIAGEFADRLFQQILGFGEYGFPESHSSSFALLVYASLWLKVHHPGVFAASLVNSQPMGFYTPASIVKDAQRHGVEVRPVRVESSSWDCTLEGDAIRLGLRVVRGFAEAAAAKITAVRAERPFEGVDDFRERCSLAKDEIELLADAGALEGLESCRREALWRLRAPREAGLFGGDVIEPAGHVGLVPMNEREQLALDSVTTGISLEDHPMRHLREALRARGVRLASEQQSWRRGEVVTVAGVVLTRQRPMTASGIVFVTLEDETGIMNLVLYNDVFERFEMVARHAGMMLARGPVDRRGPVVHVRVQHLERLEMPPTTTAPFLVRSRDFH
jgi:error-prone DNA polymerase